MIIPLLLGIVLLVLFEGIFYNRFIYSVQIVFPEKQLTIRKFVKRLLLFLNLYPVIAIIALIYSIVSGNKFYLPENIFFDYLIVYPFWVFFILTVQFDILFLLFQLLRFALSPLYKKLNNKYANFAPKVYLIIIAVFILYIPLRIIYDYNSVEVNRVNFVKENLPESLNKFKIVLISDIQADRYTDKNRLTKFVNKVNQQEPDLILMGGDMITGSSKYIKLSAEIMSELRADYGVYSCVGDHDNWAYREDTKRSLREVEAEFAKVGIPILDNANIYIPVDTSKIFITALTNTYVRQAEVEIVDSLTNGNSAAIKIFLTHQPRNKLIAAANKNNYDMYLCGHTHGGQITFFFPFYNLSPTIFETKYVRGYYNFNGMLVYVTSGLGMSIIPFRYNSTPEITIITLSKK